MADPTTDTFQEEARVRRRLPVAVNLATAILVIVTSVTVVFVIPALITDLTSDRTVGIGAVLLAAVQVAVTLAVLVLSVLVRRGRRRAWLTLVWLLVLDAVTGPIRLWVGRDDELSAADLPIALASAAVTLVFVALLVAPRSSRAYFRPAS
ncbi:MAG: hypothetical protein V7603_6028 [Micromonosporaceae bacterium]